MIKGTPDFVGERLTEAREVRKINQTELSEMLGVSRQMISQYEREKSSPSPDTLAQISRVLRFPVHRFTRPMSAVPTGTLYFRSLAAATKAARTRASRRHAWVRDDVCDYLMSLVEFRPVNFPSLSVPDDPTELHNSDIERLADETRSFWGMADGPLTDITLLLENNGGIVIRPELAANKLDAFSEWSPKYNRPFFTLGSDKASAVRSRWDAAHELGHMILHRHLREKTVRGTKINKLLEDQAHYYAEALLLPATSFGQEANSVTLNSFVALKSRWKVSISGMIRRAFNLGKLTEQGKTRLYTYMSMKGWKREEPFDKEWKPEQPRFIRRSLNLLMSEGVASRADIESAAGLHADDIESALGLEAGFLGDDVDHFQFPGLKMAN